METRRFIDGPTSILLDLVRGGAALVVLIAHGVQLGFYTGPWPFTQELQHDAVLLFFVLSGIVIRSSVEREDANLRDYAIKRARRILPVSIAAVAFSTVAFLICERLGAPVSGASPYARLSPPAVLLPLLFLSERPNGVGPVLDPSYWSLCYEVGYYALFGAFHFLRGTRRIVAIVVLAFLFGPFVMLLLPSWAFGVALAATPAARRITPSQGLALLGVSVLGIAVCSAVGFAAISQYHVIRWGLNMKTQGFSDYAVSDAVLGLYFAFGFAGLRGLAPTLAAPLRALAPFARGIAGISFTLYLFHWPIIGLMMAMGLSAGSSMTRFLALMLVPLASAFLLSRGLERGSPPIIRQRWRPGGCGAVADPVAL